MHILYKLPVFNISIQPHSANKNGIRVRSVFELTIGLVLGGMSCSPINYNKKISLFIRRHALSNHGEITHSKNSFLFSF